MNTCSRLESTSRRGRIQCSKEVAALLIKSGKERWVEKRTDVVSLKGKGEVQSYWLNVGQDRGNSVGSLESDQAGVLRNLEAFGKATNGLDDRTKRLIDWNVQVRMIARV